MGRITAFHGSKSLFDRFDLKKAGASDDGILGKAIYLTPDKEQAEAFAKHSQYGKGSTGVSSYIATVSVNLKKPFVVVNGTPVDDIPFSRSELFDPTFRSQPKIQRWLKKHGFDGALYYTDSELTQVVVFNPNDAQIIGWDIVEMKRNPKMKRLNLEDSIEPLDPFELKGTKDIVERFRRWHWGKAPTHMIQIDDDRFPEHNLEIGRLMEMQVDLVSDKGRRLNPKQSVALEIDEKSINECHVLFDHDHPKDRIYIHLNEETQQDFADLYPQLETKPVQLQSVANLTGGHHGKMKDYPKVTVKPMGRLTHLAYYTHKSGDDDGVGSGYQHEMGEEKNGVQPILCVAEDGTIWLAGGSYTCPYAGITN